jgi:undecaprenyl diphosphate synthase
MDLKEAIIPDHIAITMDGNGRWAKQRGAERIFGHNHATKAVRESIECCGELGVKHLTLFAFSTENWNRPKYEVDALMELLVRSLKKEAKELNEKGVRLTTIGEFDNLPSRCKREMKEVMQLTKDNTGLNVVLALSYSGQWDIIQATKKLVEKGAEINQENIEAHLSTKDIPNPDLLIRTSGEHRVSNFFLWQAAYTELYFTEVLWPDFRKEHLIEAIKDFTKRERRFGKTSDQLHLSGK